MKCEIAGCQNEQTNRRLKIADSISIRADWEEGKKWNGNVCEKHYNESHSSRQIVETTEEEINRFNGIIETQKETIRKRNLLIKNVRMENICLKTINKSLMEGKELSAYRIDELKKELAKELENIISTQGRL